jgi:hypothetical protein
MAERGGFEPSRPFISHMLPRFDAHFLTSERKSRRQNEVCHRPARRSRGSNPAHLRMPGPAVIVSRAAT